MIKKLLPLKSILALTLLMSQNSQAQNAINLDGTNDFIQTNYTGVTSNGARTVEAWIKTSANANPSAGGVQQIITDWGTNSSGQRFTFNILNNNALRLEINGGSVNGTIPVNNGAWHHVAVVYDPTATSKISLYVDGNLDIAGNPAISVNTGSTVKLRIGNRIDGVTFFNGSIDEVRIWSVARTASEIANNRNIEFCSPQPNLAAYYKFNNGIANGTNTSVTTIEDFSGSSNNGALTNLALSGSTSNFTSGASLTLNSINTAVTTNTNTLTSDENTAAGTTYKWLDCNNGNAVIPGETSRSYTPATSGNYAVEITKNGCKTVSSCTTFTLGTESFDFGKQIQLYPNPSSGLFSFQLPSAEEKINVSVKTITGQIIMNKNFSNTSEFSLDLNESTGIYFATIETSAGESATLKLIKK
ncbi:MAG TPA: LamG-like jellyroll fold domain-containing protein [Flavobacterium sp.]|uniref:LamG-like jellyroll fold domain-containing protein n=1 Tax=Flavobacterium sp. TaxID=239 RepID=UPI002BCDBA95|nr:LamG-like jellyroll fold domain-containing protein [Flavobacterium sp.]HSD13869.1 LamG-like jellyroll fold domain-containing protein [Flavobacterium sp.]